eukprot:10529967-Karenia_brevis.AAC.1
MDPGCTDKYNFLRRSSVRCNVPAILMCKPCMDQEGRICVNYEITFFRLGPTRNIQYLCCKSREKSSKGHR